MVREFADELLHRGMPEAIKAKKIHFSYSLLRRPFVYRDAVSGYKHASAVVSESAMQENLFVRIIAKQFQELRHLLVTRRCPPAHWNMHKPHAQSSRGAAFPIEFFAVFSPKIYDRRYS